MKGEMDDQTASAEGKFLLLQNIIKRYSSLLVAYSGGVDSTFLLKVAFDLLQEKAVAITAVSASLPALEREQARQVARWIGARQVEIDSQELENPDYLENTPQRCYFCKSEVYSLLAQYARQHGFQALADGTNVDDQGDHRPGRQAAREMGMRSPLLEAGLTKVEIRSLARQAGLPNWDKPAAACLSSRVPYGTTITLDTLSRIEQAERVLIEKGFREVRVRSLDETARIEVPAQEFSRLVEQREDILQKLKDLGYVYVSLDLQGLRSGSLNEALTRHGRR